MTGRPEHPHWLRLLLATLTVLAAFMHLTRSPEAGGLGTAGFQNLLGPLTPLRLPSPFGKAAGQMPQDMRATRAVYGSGHGGQLHGAPAHQGLGTRRHSRHDDHLAAHCPFCLTTAFALEAGVAGLPQGPPHQQLQPVQHAEQCGFSAARCIRARAPPFEVRA